MKLSNLEFNATPSGEVEVRQFGTYSFTLSENDREFIKAFIDLLIEKQPIAYEALCRRYQKSEKNNTWYEFLIVRGYIKCNFLVLDNKLDIDDNGNLNNEFVICPRTGECKECGLICNSPKSTELTDREIQVLRLIKDGYDNYAISDQLYISINTVHNHRNNILRKLGKCNTAELVSYWYESGLK